MAISLRSVSVFFLSLTCLSALHAPLRAQERDDARSLEHRDYDRWNTINGSALSNDGSWVMYSLRDGKESVTLKFREADSSREYSIPNGTGAKFTDDSQFAVFRVTPSKALLEKLKKEKTKPEELPHSKLTVLHLESGRTTTFDNVNSFKTPRDNSEWVAFLLGKGKDEATLKRDKSPVNEKLTVTPEGLQRQKPKPAKSK